MYCTVQALGELAVLFPVAGSFAAYSTRFLDPAWGFAMGWNYAMQWLVVLPLEIVSASITVDYWVSGRLSQQWTIRQWEMRGIVADRGPTSLGARHQIERRMGLYIPGLDRCHQFLWCQRLRRG